MSRPSSFQAGGPVVTALKAGLAAVWCLRATSGKVPVRLVDGSLVITVGGSDKQMARNDDLLWLGLPARFNLGTAGRPSRRSSTRPSMPPYPRPGRWRTSPRDAEVAGPLGRGRNPLVAGPAESRGPGPAGWCRRASPEPRGPRHPAAPAGLCAWGPDAAAVLRHVEAWEFLFEWVYYRDLAGMPSVSKP